VVADQLDSEVFAALALGDGGFGAPIVTAAPDPEAVAVGDFNEDGRTDVAVAVDTGQLRLNVMFGNGDGTFPNAAIAGNCTGVVNNVVVADFNGDRHLDLATSYTDETTTDTLVALFLGYGDGGFAAPVTTLASGSDPQNLVAGDFNGDGRIDLAEFSVGQSGSGEGLTLLLAAANGTYSSTFYPVSGFGSQPAGGAVGDFNGDGIADLATVWDSSDLILYLGGDGGFTPTTTTLGFGFYNLIAAGDFTGDGLLDLAISDGFAGVQVLRGAGDGGFGAVDPAVPAGVDPSALVAFPPADGGPMGLAVADYGTFGGNADAGITLLEGNACH
jgi:hypothetical protein